MKKYVKKHKIICLIIFLLLSYIFISCNNLFKDINASEIRRNNIQQQCEKEQYLSTDNDYLDYCTRVLNDKDLKIDFFTVFTEIVLYKIRFLNPLAFVILIVPSIFYVCKILKSKFLINDLTRENYNMFLKRLFKEAYKYVWLLPFLASVIIMICAFNYTFDPTFSIHNMSSIWTKSILIYHPYIFIFLYLLNIFIHSCIFINISLIVVRKHHNYISACILSVLLYVGIQLFFEVFINSIIMQMIFKTEIGYIFNIMNLYTFSDSFGLIELFTFLITMLLISMVVVLKLYCNKEKLVIDCEKNK